MPKYQLLDKSFETQEEFKNFIRSVLQKWLYLDPFYSEHLRALCERHPEIHTKAPNGIKAFRVQQNPRNKKALELYLIRPDGTEIDISWLTCIKGVNSTPKQNLKRAMRYAIREQIRNFTITSWNKSCDICGEIDGYFHVDHDVPTFKELADSFVSLWCDKVPEKFTDVPDTNDADFLPDDEEFKVCWQIIHREKAQLRKLCAHCNLTRKK